MKPEGMWNDLGINSVDILHSWNDGWVKSSLELYPLIP